MIPLVCDDFVMKFFQFGYNTKPVWLNFYQFALQNGIKKGLFVKSPFLFGYLSPLQITSTEITMPATTRRGTPFLSGLGSLNLRINAAAVA